MSKEIAASSRPKKWFVYIIRCDDNSLYTGVTLDITRRFREHQMSNIGAKYTKAHKPVAVVYEEICSSRSEAQVREAAIKKLSRAQKEALITS